MKSDKYVLTEIQQHLATSKFQGPIWEAWGYRIADRGFGGNYSPRLLARYDEISDQWVEYSALGSPIEIVTEELLNLIYDAMLPDPEESYDRD